MLDCRKVPGLPHETVLMTVFAALIVTPPRSRSGPLPTVADTKASSGGHASSPGPQSKTRTPRYALRKIVHVWLRKLSVAKRSESQVTIEILLCPCREPQSRSHMAHQGHTRLGFFTMVKKFNFFHLAKWSQEVRFANLRVTEPLSVFQSRQSPQPGDK